MRKRLQEETVSESHDEPLHQKYRPRRLKDVVGQDAVVSSLESMLKAKNRPHCFLFTGPSGVGKTTFVKILAEEFECDPANFNEHDAASNSGKDDMAVLLAGIRYQGFGEKPNKFILIDECHGLSKQAWDSLLIVTETPPPHVYFCFCSTAPEKIPTTMLTRCVSYHLKAVKFNALMDLLESVCEAEKLSTPTRHLEMIAGACSGSPRHALTMLAAVHDCREDDEVAALLAQPLENKEVIDLCRMLVSGDLDWPKLTATLKSLEMPAESIRIVISCYLASCLMGAKSDKSTIRLLDIAEVFAKPFNTSDKLAPLFLAFGRLLFP